MPHSAFPNHTKNSIGFSLTKVLIDKSNKVGANILKSILYQMIQNVMLGKDYSKPIDLILIQQILLFC